MTTGERKSEDLELKLRSTGQDLSSANHKWERMKVIDIESNQLEAS